MHVEPVMEENNMFRAFWQKVLSRFGNNATSKRAGGRPPRVLMQGPHGGDYVEYRFLDEAGADTTWEQCVKVTLRECLLGGQVVFEQTSIVEERTRSLISQGFVVRHYDYLVMDGRHVYTEMHFFDAKEEYVTQENSVRSIGRVCDMSDTLLQEHWFVSDDSSGRGPYDPLLVVRAQFADRSGSREEQLSISDRAVIGRANDCDLMLDDPQVSRHCCALLLKPDGLYVVDLDSTNGTLLNQRPVTTETQLHSGDEVRVGQTTIRLEFSFNEAALDE